MTLATVIQKIHDALLPIYGGRESELMTSMLLEHHTGWDATVLHAMQHHELPGDVEQAVVVDLDRLEQSYPIQYILGYVWFYDMQLAVNPHVLIPRPETEELVHRIVQDIRASGNPMRVLDLGTGSGCIPLGIKKAVPYCDVSACDISKDALSVARSNAQQQQLAVSFFEYDILSEGALPHAGPYDIMVSNPPYIPLKDRANMHRNVVDHEPSLALFVTDEDPLLFYRKLAHLGRKILRDGGHLYVEIHEDLAKDVVALLQSLQYDQVEVFRDMQGKERMVKALHCMQ